MSGALLQPEFIGPDGERIFVLVRRPAQECTGCVLIVPAFAEEMNKSRRMTSLVAHALAQRGLLTVTPDLYGTGDSDGNFEEASWQRWVADVIHVQQWCTQQGFPATGMIGNRLGCALGVEAMRECGAALTTTVFWQPVTNGARAVDQFLRLRVAGTLMSEEARETVKDLRLRLRSGETLEVGGYALSPSLVASMDEVKLTAMSVNSARLHWIEVARSVDAALPAPSIRAIEEFRVAGREVAWRQIVGEPYWSSTEIVVLPELVERTVAVFSEAA